MKDTNSQPPKKFSFHLLRCLHTYCTPPQKNGKQYLAHVLYCYGFVIVVINVYKVINTELNAIQINRNTSKMRNVCKTVCVADVLCSLSDSQQYPAADSLSGRADWLTGVCGFGCVFSCVWKQGSLFCLQQINVPLRERGTWDKERERLREKERALGKQILLSFPSPISASSFTDSANFFSTMQDEISDVELPQWNSLASS